MPFDPDTVSRAQAGDAAARDALLAAVTVPIRAFFRSRIGGAPEGVLAAAALRCIGGQMQGRLQLNTEEKIARAAKMGISDPNKVYRMDEMAKGDVLFAAEVINGFWLVNKH